MKAIRWGRPIHIALVDDATEEEFHVGHETYPEMARKDVTGTRS